MVRIAASVDGLHDVTFVMRNGCLQTQELINGRRGLLDKTSPSAHPGDNCLVEIVSENRNQTLYFVRIVSTTRLAERNTNELVSKPFAPMIYPEGKLSGKAEGTTFHKGAAGVLIEARLQSEPAIELHKKAALGEMLFYCGLYQEAATIFLEVFEASETSRHQAVN